MTITKKELIAKIVENHISFKTGNVVDVKKVKVFLKQANTCLGVDLGLVNYGELAEEIINEINDDHYYC